MKKRSTKPATKSALDDPMLKAIFAIMLAELTPLSRRKLLELPASELRRLSAHYRRQVRSARRRAA